MKKHESLFRALLILCYIVWVHQLNAQVLQGIVTDENDRHVEGVYIYNEISGNHVHTDKGGSFTLQGLKLGDSLIISHVGYVTQIIKVTDFNKALTIKMAEKVVSLNEITIKPVINATSMFVDIDIETTPVNSSQEILRKVPGITIGQHAGGGKAEQVFIRGFDADHGTDINITSDGIPVNMVSHAHGQGYADLHFIIPETVDKIDFGKGCYYADKGNFSTGGYVAFKTKEKLENSELKLEGGQFNTGRLVGLFNMLNDDHQSAYVATEYLFSDGPFESSQHFKRVNLQARYTASMDHDDKLSLLVSHFNSSWNASGQIPQRAVDQGLITRFGAIDDTEGGTTSRTNLLMGYTRYLNNNNVLRNKIYFSNYQFDLFSNFTFFLNDPVNGDQIRQKEDRHLFGMVSEWERVFNLHHAEWGLTAGLSWRNDQVLNAELSHTANRQTILDQLALGDVNETNIAGYINNDIRIGDMVINPSVRFDLFLFQYDDKLQTSYGVLSAEKVLVSPKMNIMYNVSSGFQLYLKSGKGFHSNDTRVVVQQKGKEILPAAYGSDLGFIWKASDRLLINTACWYLFMQQEFVYVGDEGIVEPGGKTRRAGVDASFRYQLTAGLFVNTDVNYANARAIDGPAGNDFISLAPSFTSTGGLSYVNKTGLHGNINYRYVGDRPANEDNSIIAEGYFIVDANIGYQWKNMGIGLKVENLLDRDWKETQFATETRLQNETQPVEENHFIPGTPFFLKAMVGFRF